MLLSFHVHVQTYLLFYVIFSVKVTLRSAGTYISSGTLQIHLCVTLITLVIHLFLSNSHVFHLWVTWSARCPVNASRLTYQGLEASFCKAFTNLLVFCKGSTYFSPFSFQFNASPFPSTNHSLVLWFFVTSMPLENF